MFFMSFFVKVASILSSLIFKPYKPYITVPMTIPNNTRCFSEYKVYLLYKGGERVEITQPPGSCYPYLPSDYQADSYIVVSIADGRETYINDKISVNIGITRRIRKSIMD